MSFPALAPLGHSYPPPSPADGRSHVAREGRTKLFLGAQLVLPGEQAREVRIRDLSASGAKIDMASPPPVGTTLLLRRGAAEIAAEVVWVEAAGCGLRFAQAIDVASLRSDRPSAAVTQFPQDSSLADDLALARRLIERLENALGEEPAVVAALGTELQALDLLGQLLRTSEKRAQGSTAPTIRSLLQAIATFLRTPARG